MRKLVLNNIQEGQERTRDMAEHLQGFKVFTDGGIKLKRSVMRRAADLNVATLQENK